VISPSVSVVIPAYKAAGTIRHAIESVLAQTRAPEEIVVVDDGSPDDLASALESFGGLVTLIRKENGGAASARNLGIDRSRGDLIAFMDADDHWEPTKLARQLAALEAHPRVGLAATRYYTQPQSRPRHISPIGKDEDYGRELVGTGAQVFEYMKAIWTTTVVVRREALKDLRFQPGLEPAEDRDLWVRMILAGPIYIDPEPLATWMLGPDSLSESNIDRDCTNMLRVLDQHRGLLGRRGFRAWEADIFRRWAAGHLGRGRPEAALGPAKERLRRQPTSVQAWWIYCKCLSMPTGRRGVEEGAPQTTLRRPLMLRIVNAFKS